MSPRRVVRVTEQFFGRLDELLPSQRPGDGRCSASDFLLWDLPEFIEIFATDQDSRTTEAPGRPGVLMLSTVGRLVPFVTIYAEIVPDGSVEVFWLEIDSG